MKVFISHTFSDEDKKLAESLKQILSEAGIVGYLAESRRNYDKLIRDKIIAEIKNSDHMIAILTEKTIDSASVNQELGYALRDGLKPIIMREENAKQGVLTFGIDTEDFTKDTFLESCKRVLEHIKEQGFREKIPENISEKLEEINSKLETQKSQNTMGYSDSHPEVQWYTEIMKYCNDDTKLPEEIGTLPTDAKECYSEIQMLRQEISEISNSYDKGNQMTQDNLANILRSKRSVLKSRLNELRDMWIRYVD